MCFRTVYDIKYNNLVTIISYLVLLTAAFVVTVVIYLGLVKIKLI